MLDAPFYYSGAVGGVICHEHVGAARTWSDADVTLACSIADMAAVICGQAKLIEAQERLRDATTRRLDNSRIAITSRALGADRVELVVSDDGPGVAPDIANRLFELYATTSAHGTGVGLWLVKKIVTEVGESIRYEPGFPGARFVTELPRRTS